jgi:hypothetical protein
MVSPSNPNLFAADRRVYKSSDTDMLLVSSSTPPLSGNPLLIWPEILEVQLEIWTQVAVLAGRRSIAHLSAVSQLQIFHNTLQ